MAAGAGGRGKAPGTAGLSPGGDPNGFGGVQTGNKASAGRAASQRLLAVTAGVIGTALWQINLNLVKKGCCVASIVVIQ